MNYQSFMEQSQLFIRIIAACICGVVVGYERKNRNKEAGIRTHAIVALGSALIMIVSKYGFSDVGGYDASRVAAQIVSGVGFLGAGIIFIKNNTVSGLTTAAGIWATSGVGMAIGSGMFYMGVVTTILIIVLQFLLHKQFVFNKDHKYELIEFTTHDKNGAIGDVQTSLQKNNIEIVSIEMSKSDDIGYKVELGLFLPIHVNKAELTKLIFSCDDICSTRC